MSTEQQARQNPADPSYPGPPSWHDLVRRTDHAADVSRTVVDVQRPYFIGVEVLRRYEEGQSAEPRIVTFSLNGSLLRTREPVGSAMRFDHVAPMTPRGPSRVPRGDPAPRGLSLRGASALRSGSAEWARHR